MCGVAAWAQQEVPLFVAEKKSSRPQAKAAMTSAQELKVKKAVPYQLTRTTDGGIVIIAGDNVYKYDAAGQQAFKANITDMFQYPDITSSTWVESDSKGTFVLEAKEGGKGSVTVIRIDTKGVARAQQYERDDFTGMYNSFILDGKLCALSFKTDKDAGKVVYKFCYLNPADGKLVSKPLDLPIFRI